jgi:hypothetical protein
VKDISFFSIPILCILICVHVLFMFFIWFFVEREGVGHIKMGGEFLLPEYGVFILPGMGQLWLSLQAQCFIVQMSHTVMITLVCHTQQNAMCKKNHNTD